MTYIFSLSLSPKAIKNYFKKECTFLNFQYFFSTVLSHSYKCLHPDIAVYRI